MSGSGSSGTQQLFTKHPNLLTIYRKFDEQSDGGCGKFFGPIPKLDFQSSFIHNFYFPISVLFLISVFSSPAISAFLVTFCFQLSAFPFYFPVVLISAFCFQLSAFP